MNFSTDDLFQTGYASSKVALLQRLLGATLVGLTRYSWVSAKAAVSEWGIPEESVFSLTAGALLIGLNDGSIIGAGSDPSLISVVVWLERDRDGREEEPRVADDKELFPISCTDAQYCPAAIRALLGTTVESMRILQREPENAKWETRPCESGLLIECTGGGKLLLSHGLHDHSDDFSVITPDQVDPYCAARLTCKQVISI